MADFGFLSDTDESAVEELISQAQELSVLEQVSAINCSGFTDSLLPTDLESRFRKLKSFPLSKPKNTTNKSLHHSKSNFSHSVKPKTESDEESSENPDGKSISDDEESEIFSASKQSPERKFSSKQKSKHGSVSVSSSPSSSSNSSKDNEIFSASKQKSKSKTGSSNSWLNSPSPPKKSGCFWCSPISLSKKKSKENRVLDTDFDWGKNEVLDTDFDWGKNDEFLSDLTTFSVKEQQKKLKKAMKEQQKISQEAEKIVKWAKQASARMSFHGIEDDVLSDAESNK